MFVTVEEGKTLECLNMGIYFMEEKLMSLKEESGGEYVTGESACDSWRWKQSICRRIRTL